MLPEERDKLFEEFKAWNELLARIHEAELEALMVEDRVAFQELQSIERKAREARDSIAKVLQ